MSPVLVILTLVAVVILPVRNANGHYNDDCPESFECGSLGTISFPFTTPEHRNCGALAIHGCHSNQTTVLGFNSGQKQLQITQVNNRRWRSSITFIDNDFRVLLENGNCKALSYNITVPPSISSSALGYFYLQNNVSAFKCNSTQKLNHTEKFVNYTKCPSFDFYFAPSSSSDDQSQLSSLMSLCSMVKLPFRQDSQFFKDGPFGFLTAQMTFEFKLSDSCRQCSSQTSGGHCRLDTVGNFYCAKR